MSPLPGRDVGRRLWPFLRLALAAGMIWYLASSGTIEWRSLGGLVKNWPLTMGALAALFAGFAMASWRFCILTKAQALHVTLGNSLRLTLIGNAANFLLPTIGSDIVRIWFASGGHGGRRTEIATIVLLDRVIGLAGIRLPLAWLMADWLDLGVAGAWYAMVIDLYLRCGLITGRFLHGGWKRVKV